MDDGFSHMEGDAPEDALGLQGDPLPSENTDSHGRLPNLGLPWRRITLAGGGALTAAGIVVVATLAATHKTAVSENATAYANGMKDALDAVRNGFDPFDV